MPGGHLNQTRRRSTANEDDIEEDDEFFEWYFDCKPSDEKWIREKRDLILRL